MQDSRINVDAEPREQSGDDCGFWTGAEPRPGRRISGHDDDSQRQSSSDRRGQETGPGLPKIVLGQESLCLGAQNYIVQNDLAGVQNYSGQETAEQNASEVNVHWVSSGFNVSWLRQRADRD